VQRAQASCNVDNKKTKMMDRVNERSKKKKKTKNNIA
jgi:hypothetical protein